MSHHTIVLHASDPDERVVLDRFLAACEPEDRIDLTVHGDRVTLTLSP